MTVAVGVNRVAMVAPKCQSSYIEARNTTVGCIADDSTFATQRIFVL